MAEKHRRGTEAPVENIYLIGFMCSGKTLAGRRLAALLRRPFRDSDYAVKSASGLSPAVLIRQRGMARFRSEEAKAVRTISGKGGQVVALGGGFYPSGRRAATLRRSGRTVFLSCSWPVLEKRLAKSRASRPLLDGPREKVLARAKELYRKRLPFYRRADITVEVSGLTPLQAAGRIKKALK